MRKPFLVFLFLLFSNLTYGAIERPEPVIPQPEEVFWSRIKPRPYTMVIKSRRYGEYNFTHEADKALDVYKRLCKETNYKMEIPAVALVNKKREIVDLICPPKENILLLNIDMDKIYEYNRENPGLLEDLSKPNLIPDQKDNIIQRIIANAIYHPLGRFCLVNKNNRQMVLAEVLNQKVYLPIECLDISLDSLVQRKSGISEEVPLRKDWYIITTPNTCLWTDYFINYVERESKGMDIDTVVPIHLHPWHQMQWLLETKEKYWLSEYKIHLIPSGKDIEFFKSRFPDAKLYIIVGKDLYSEELEWAVYDDISTVEREIQRLGLSIGGRIQTGVVQRYYTRKDRGLIVDEAIDALLLLNKRQIYLLKEIEGYKRDYPWRLLNTSFIIQALNGELSKKGWKIAPSVSQALGYNMDKKEFYYKEGITSRMDLFLFIIFKLCHNEIDTLGLLNGVCNELDYLYIKYNHMKEFSRHLEYLSSIIRHNIWESEKRVLIAKEQVRNGRYYLDRYNLGYYKEAENLEVISDIYLPKTGEVLGLEDMVKGLSKKYNIKNEEEFIMEFEKGLVLRILQILLD